MPSRVRFVEAVCQKQDRQLFQDDTRLSGTGENSVTEEFSLDSLNRSCLCKHIGFDETCTWKGFQAGILVSPRRLIPE